MEWNPEDTPETLREAYRAERDTMLGTRLHALWLLRTGRRMDEVASVVGIHYRTLQRWVSWYRRGGVQEVLSHRMKGLGQPRFLSPDQERELVEEVGSGRLRTGVPRQPFLPVVRHVRTGRPLQIAEPDDCSPTTPLDSNKLTASFR